MRLSNQERELIKRRIEACIQSRDRKQWYKTAERMRELYQGYIWPGSGSSTGSQTLDNEHRVTVNLAQINTDIMVSSIAYADPEFMIVPMEPAAQENAQYQKAALSKVWSEINALHTERKRLKDAIIYGFGVNFVGWRYEERDSAAQEGVRPAYMPQEGPLPTLVRPGGELVPPPEELSGPESMQQFPQEAGLEGGTESIFEEGAAFSESPMEGGLGPVPVEFAPQEYDTRNIVYDNPVVRRVQPHKFFVDLDHSDLTDLTDAKYVIEEKLVPEKVVKNDWRYKNTEHLKGDNLALVDDIERDKKEKLDSGDLYIKLYEYWQRDGRVHIIFADGQWDKPLLVEEWPYPFNSYPYTTLVFRDIPDEQMPQGAIEPCETSIKLYNLYRSIQIRHDEQLARCPVGYDTNKLTEDGKKALKGRDTMPLVECAGPPAETIQPIQLTPLSRDFYITQDAIKDDVNIGMAVNDYMKGVAGTTRRTFGEVQSIISLSASRSQILLRDYEIACAKDAQLVLNLLQDPMFCDRERWMVITGQQNNEMQPMNWNADTIKGQSDVKVVCNSTRVQTPENVQQNMVLAIQALAQPAQAGMINIMPFLKKFAQSLNMSPTEMREIMNVEKQGGGEMQQAIAQIVQVLQNTVGQVEQLGQQVGMIMQALNAGAADAQTQAAMARQEQQMRHAEDKHSMQMRMMEQKQALEVGKTANQIALQNIKTQGELAKNATPEEAEI